MSKNTVQRKQRITKAQKMDFIEWCFRPEIADIIANASYNKIRQIYYNNTGRDVSISFIRNQKNKWICINGKICKRE